MPRSDQSITTNVDRLELRRLRMAHSPPILRGGFRPFFLGTAMWALVALTLWLAILFGLEDFLSLLQINLLMLLVEPI